jgi:hypothetical protein
LVKYCRLHYVMTESTWETRFEETVANQSRNFSIGSTEKKENTIKICNAFCSFQLKEWEFEDYIQGMSITGSDKLLYIDPLVDTSPPSEESKLGKQTIRKKENKKDFIILWNGDFYSSDPTLALITGGQENKYYLQDIFIQAPGKTAYMGTKYKMEVCLLFQDSQHQRSLVLVTPLEPQLNNKPPEDPSLLGLHQTLLKISKNFPLKGKTYSIPKVESWTPRMFLPRYDKRKFTRWTDPNNPNLAYVYFYSPNSALPVPRDFYVKFAEILAGSMSSLQKLTNEPTNTMSPDIFLELNENIPPIPVENEYKVETIQNPYIQETIHKASSLEKKTEEKKRDCPKCSKEKSSNTSIYLSLGLGAFLIFIAWIIYKKFIHQD